MKNPFYDQRQVFNCQKRVARFFEKMGNPFSIDFSRIIWKHQFWDCKHCISPCLRNGEVHKGANKSVDVHCHGNGNPEVGKSSNSIIAAIRVETKN